MIRTPRVLLMASMLGLAALACSLFPLTQSNPKTTSAPIPTTDLSSPTPLIIATPTVAIQSTSESPEGIISSTPTEPRPSPSPLHDQILREVWGAVNDHYLYRDFNGLDWNAVLQEYSNLVQTGLTDEAFYQALGEMIARLGDDHSTFFDPPSARQFDRDFAGASGYAGIGVLHTPIPEKRKLAVILVFPGSPAERAGIRPHDSILAVDGQQIFDEQGTRLNLLPGPEGTTIQVTVQTPGQSPRQVSITRQRISSQTPVPHRIYTTPDGKRVGYLFLRTFNESGIDEQVGSALIEMLSSTPLDGIIVDNRHNTGGVSEVFFNTLAYFTQGEVGKFDQQGQLSSIRVPPVEMESQYLPLVVLVGPDTASFGEVFAGIIQDLGRGTIIGEQTPGNVELLKVFDFSDGSRAWIANATFRPLNHPEIDWEQSGIQPDILASSQWDEVTEDNDPVIQAALQFFDGAIQTGATNP